MFTDLTSLSENPTVKRSTIRHSGAELSASEEDDDSDSDPEPASGITSTPAQTPGNPKAKGRRLSPVEAAASSLSDAATTQRELLRMREEDSRLQREMYKKRIELEERRLQREERELALQESAAKEKSKMDLAHKLLSTPTITDEAILDKARSYLDKLFTFD